MAIVKENDMDLSVNYLGVKLKSPIIVGSSGLTNSVKKIKKAEKSGAGAVVLKSIFEEEISFEHTDFIEKESKKGGIHQYFEYDGKMNPIEFYDYKIREDNLKKYTQLISESKSTVSIPIIASINCCHNSVEWIFYAKQIEAAGADAIELNMFFLPSNFNRTKEETDAIYFRIINPILQTLNIPVSLKISYYFSDLGLMIKRLSETGVKGIVLFNRFFSPDFDIQTFEVKPSFIFSSESDFAVSLRWISIMAQRSACDLCASTGVHNSEAFIKQILAGANAVQVVSCLYKNGTNYIETLLNDLEIWMHNKGFKTIEDFRGKMSQSSSKDPSLYERVQFMKYFGGKKSI